MNRYQKRWIRVFLLGGIVGIIVTFVHKSFFPQVSEKDFLRNYFIFAPIVVVLVMGINLFFARRKYQVLNKLTPLAKTDPQKYIEEAEKQLQIIKNPMVREVVKVNIGAAYCNLDDYEQAKEILEKIQRKHLSIQNLFVYQMDLSYLYFNLGEEEKGIEAYEQIPTKVIPLIKSQELKALLLINEIHYLAAKKELEKAKQVYLESQELLAAAKEEKDIRKLERLLELS